MLQTGRGVVFMAKSLQSVNAEVVGSLPDVVVMVGSGDMSLHTYLTVDEAQALMVELAGAVEQVQGVEV